MTPPKPAFATRVLSPAAVEAARVRFGLDKPVFINTEEGNPFDSQYFKYLGALADGDLGTSYAFNNRSVTSLIGQALRNTVWLILPAQVLSIMAGRRSRAVGRLAPGHQNRCGRPHLLTVHVGAADVLPGHPVAVLRQPLSGVPQRRSCDDRCQLRELAGISSGTSLRHLFLPTLTFTLVLLGEYMLVMRSSVVEVFGEDYIQTAKAKGLTTLDIIRKHAFRNAMLPIVTLIALNLGFTVSGAIQVETVFSWPGLGKLTVDAVSQRDYPVLQGAFLLLAIAVIVTNLFAELLYLRLDPRVTDV